MELIGDLGIGEHFIFEHDVGTTIKAPVYKVISPDKVINLKTGTIIQFKQVGLGTYNVVRLDLMHVTNEDAARVCLAVLLSNPVEKKVTDETQKVYRILRKLTEAELDVLYDGLEKYKNAE